MICLNKIIRSAVVVLLLSVATSLYAAADYAREQRWAEEITPGILVGDPLYLEQTNHHKFLGIYTAATQPKMGVIVVHGMGLHPDWGMIGMLRQQLTDAGFSTLSIQMPVLAAEVGFEAYPALFPEAMERLQLAVNYLKSKGYRRIAIVSHSNGSRMTRTYMVTNPADVTTWIALSLTQGDTFEGIKAPVLDLYAENDLPHVLASTVKRKASLKNPDSQQKLVPNADHFFTGREDSMIRAVQNYLNEVIKPKITGPVDKCF